MTAISGNALAKDSYLDALSEEVSDLTVDSAVKIDQANAPATPEQDGIPSDLNQSGFEELLRSRYIGSFMFYNKLSDKDKGSVFTEYQSSKDIELIRKKIISLFSSN